MVKEFKERNNTMIKQLDLSEQYKNLNPEILDRVKQVFETQQFVMGNFVGEFEKSCAGYLDIKHAIAVASGSDALLIALLSIGIQRGDKVITTPFTFFATASAITRLGAIPLFVDIDPSTFNLSVSAIEQALKKHHRVKAILPVHLYGRSADMEGIMKLAKKYSMYVVEDAAQAFGARSRYRNEYKKAGTVGDIGCFSFYPTKNLGGAGDGGMLVTSNDKLASLLKMLRAHGSPERYVHKYHGINSRLDALQAVVLSVKLNHIEQWNHTRMELAKRYNELFTEAGLAKAITLPDVPEDMTHIFHQYTVRIKNRDSVRQALKEDGIGTEVYYPIPLHLQPVFKYLGYKKGSLKQTELAAKEVLSLPLYPEMTVEQQIQVVESFKKIQNSKLKIQNSGLKIQNIQDSK